LYFNFNSPELLHFNAAQNIEIFSYSLQRPMLKGFDTNPLELRFAVLLTALLIVLALVR
tara:strand:+ start:8145 stop:8321 length:177 start_codon:yes stop_codon:yes gene_type:complete